MPASSPTIGQLAAPLHSSAQLALAGLLIKLLAAACSIALRREGQSVASIGKPGFCYKPSGCQLKAQWPPAQRQAAGDSCLQARRASIQAASPAALINGAIVRYNGLNFATVLSWVRCSSLIPASTSRAWSPPL